MDDLTEFGCPASGAMDEAMRNELLDAALAEDPTIDPEEFSDAIDYAVGSFPAAAAAVA